ncbi:GAF domain-containing protein [Actinokineospora spheciospongiae]|uniref:GAF domain-containing protein n=1 Tax=Actinokineospora spheciospongiae TaxID=909613 RepID=W7J2D3_9PSEU|nr:GAF and ANTAR domain-containing protein [Actinokineospora spheciospongiae]EWC63222.1 GAF domain-containing protein [Actinokineospora spheciospongiae]PWW66946.1 GAF domain-containing protein [Actinokineospora spheciospongiae]
MGQQPERAWPVVLDEVTAAVESLTAALDSVEDFTLLLQQVCEQVTRAVPGVDEASITLLVDGSPRTAATTSDIPARLDRDQYATGDGPCLRAASTGHLVRVSVEEAAEQWPAFAKDARAAGFGSFLSAPLTIDEEYTGAVNCYSAAEHGFAELDVKLLDLYTSTVTATLRVHRRYQRARDTTEQLIIALETRAVIDQAKGILMALRQIPADEAFTLLAEQSQRENIKLRDLAARFVAHTTGRPDHGA